MYVLITQRDHSNKVEFLEENFNGSYLASEYMPEQIFFSLNTHMLQLLVSLCPSLLLIAVSCIEWFRYFLKYILQFNCMIYREIWGSKLPI